ncbi:MAG TPA: SHOCT domain-containing protein [Tepidiformaceae bacterium]|jgi:uncharacterized membrane protein
MWGAFEGMGWWMIFGALSWVLFLGAIIFLAITSPGRKPSNAGQRETALEIARRRYASGDISQREFEQLRDDLLK